MPRLKAPPKTRSRSKTAPKVAKKATASKSTKKSKVALSKATVFALFESRLKPDVLHFEYDKEITSPETQTITVKAVANECRVKVSQSMLDVYSSPYRLDLSKTRFIEKHQPKAKKQLFLDAEILPGGKFIKKSHVLDLIDFDRSEILGRAKAILNKAEVRWKHSKYQKSLGSRLSSKAHHSSYATTWRDIALFSAVYSIFNGIKKVILAINFYISRSKNKANDEVFALAVANPNISSRLQKNEKIPRSIVVEELIRINSDEPYQITSSVKSSTQSRPTVSLLSWQFALKPLIAFAILAIVVALPVKVVTYWQDINVAKGEVLGDTETALQNLEQAKTEIEQLNFIGASDHISTANDKFISAKQQLDGVTALAGIVTDLIPINNVFRSGNHLLQLGEHLTAAGKHLLSAASLITTSESQLVLTDKIKAFQIESQRALVDLKKSEVELGYIDSKYVPEKDRDRFEMLKKSLPTLTTGLENSQGVLDFSLNFLGDKTLKRYLLVFQNDNELRATGGFMGSFALVDIKSGEIAAISTPAGGTYDLRAGLTNLYQAPQPLQLINPRWEFQDTNWWPNWPTSAKNIEQFYTKSGGPSIDGVIAINSDFLGNLLQVTGPIDMPEYGRQITSENFEAELQQNVELEADKKAPKKIIGDLMPKMLEKVLHGKPTDILKIAAAIGQGLEQKDISIYLDNQQDQEFIATHQWDGRQRETGGDYLQVVSTNIGGGKTDNVIHQTINHQAVIAQDGSIIDTVRIERSHFGPTDAYFTKQANRSYLRVYAPLGSTLINAAGFDTATTSIATTTDSVLTAHESLKSEDRAKVDPTSKTKVYNENDKTVFGNWITVKPGETQTIVLVYKLPFKIDWKHSKTKTGWASLASGLLPRDDYGSYSLLAQKQSGSNDDDIISTVTYPDALSPITIYPSDLQKKADHISLITTLSRDIFYFIGFKK